MRKLAALTISLLLAGAPAAHAAPLLHSMFQDHAVLQRDRPIRIWGEAAANEDVSISLAGSSAKARAGRDGHWAATLPAMPAGGPYTLTVRSNSGRVETARDILIGDVWLCSGQSNMAQPVNRALNERAEIAGAANDRIRLMTVATTISPAPLEQFATPVQWMPASPETAADFSAACFFFARELQKTVDVPMGLINASWGGSNIRAWMSDAGLRAVGGYDGGLDAVRLFARDPVAGYGRWGAEWQAWWRSRVPDKADRAPWAPGPMRGDWKPVPASLGPWEQWGVPELARFDGMVWYRTEVRLTARQAEQGATLLLGGVDDIDQSWVNGRAVGSLTAAGAPREYRLPPRTLHAGSNVVVVNVQDVGGMGGLLGPAQSFMLRFADGSTAPLDGPWHYRAVPATVGMPSRTPWDAVNGLTMIHNAMIAPMGSYGLRGVLWYQGETNTGEPDRYQGLLTGLMADWRSKFGADLPFLVVQLANFGRPPTTPAESGWARLREAQRLTVAADAHAGLAVAIDLGERTDIHPANKQEVGRRLARAARHVVYGEAIAPSGPVPVDARREGDRVIVSFADAEGELIAYGNPDPIGFELCGQDQASCRYVSAKIEGRGVVLPVAADGAPTRVRFCWADSPVCTLYDRAGLPAGPFELAID